MDHINLNIIKLAVIEEFLNDSTSNPDNYGPMNVDYSNEYAMYELSYDLDFEKLYNSNADIKNITNYIAERTKDLGYLREQVTSGYLVSLYLKHAQWALENEEDYKNAYDFAYMFTEQEICEDCGAIICVAGAKVKSDIDISFDEKGEPVVEVYQDMEVICGNCSSTIDMEFTISLS